VIEPPVPRRIYHITHADNLSSILSNDGLLSDAEMIARGGPQVAVGMTRIKQRRLRLPVKCHPGDYVGEYVPFYFCPRSIMLYLLHMGNHPELSYRGGQGPILHLEADLEATACWADAAGARWAFSLSHAGGGEHGCVGVMGRGIALEFKIAYPANFKAYAAACKRGEVQPGRMFVFDTGQLAPRWIINFPTKRHWRGKSRLEDIEAGLVALVQEIRARDIRSIAIPPLGSGLGGLDWRNVRPLIEGALADLADVRIVVHEPSSRPIDTRAKRSTATPKMTAGRAALVGLMRRYLAGLMDPSISLLEIHKLMYFLQAAGEPLKLRYVKAPYGPYAENLRHVLQAINGHLISGYTGEGDAPTEQLTLEPGAVDKANAFLAAHPSTGDRFDRVTALVDGFETPFGVELLATAHWVATNEHAQTEQTTADAIHNWNPGKAQFMRQQIGIAVARLRAGAG
jgi:O-acetyl-ADP-ribose deacetylase (regulator of RNase III)